MNYVQCPPSAPALTDSLRGVGYSSEAAVADLVDNSIAAGARNVWIQFRWSEECPVVCILDDGIGMSDAELLEAMRFGSVVGERRPDDLGRFGLGLKTASFSQCRVVTVASKQGDVIRTLRWDLDYVANVARDWHVLVGASAAANPLLSLLDDIDSGTLVVWEQLDRIVQAPGAAGRDQFLEAADHVKRHLGLVFHWFLADAPRPVKIGFGSPGAASWIQPVDPFLLEHPATTKLPEEVLQQGIQTATVQGFVLPHRDRLTEREFEVAGRHDGWTANQGFYVYRNHRLLIWGTWLGLGEGSRLWSREEAYKLARIRVDIDPTGDFDWAIDIKKSRARAPGVFRPRLRAIAAEVRQRAKAVLVHRGAYGPHQSVPNLQAVWLTKRATGHTTYVVNRRHPSLARLQANLSEFSRAELDAFLRLIELSVPVQRIWLEASEEPAVAEESDLNLGDEELHELVARLHAYFMNSLSLSREDARLRCLSTEPLNRAIERVDAIIQRLQ